MNLLKAMATFEGYDADPKNRPTRNHNPGNITWGEFARQHGATHIEEIPEGYTSTPRYAYFPSEELGWRAMHTLLRRNYGDLTVREAITKWAPPIENDTEAYIAHVCKKCECSEDTKVAELLKNVHT